MKALCILAITISSFGMLLYVSRSRRNVEHDEQAPFVAQGTARSLHTPRFAMFTHRTPVGIEVFPISALPECHEWEEILLKCVPERNSKATHATRVHAALLWGFVGKPRPTIASDFVNMSLNHSVFSKFVDGKPLLVRTRNGASFVEASSITGGRNLISPASRDAHWGQTLSVLAEMGISLDERVQDSEGYEYQLEAVLQDLCANYLLAGEIEWATTAIAIYGPKFGTWRNRYGEVFTIEKVAKYLLSAKPGDGACMGTHVLYCLSILRQINDSKQISDELRSLINAHFLETSRLLVETQSPDGSWAVDWAGRQFSPLYPIALQPTWMTGHHLEWISQVPADLRPSEASIKKACSFVLASIEKTESTHIWKNPCTYIHGVRAAFRLLGKNVQNLPDQSRIKSIL